jgi:DNA-binding MarR family transcriptional regulator
MGRRPKKKKVMITVYLDTNDSILLKSKDAPFRVLFYILRQADMEHYMWYADKVHKQYIMSKLKIAPPTLDTHIASLKKRGFIIPTNVRGRYRLNMKIFST